MFHLIMRLVPQMRLEDMEADAPSAGFRRPAAFGERSASDGEGGGPDAASRLRAAREACLAEEGYQLQLQRLRSHGAPGDQMAAELAAEEAAAAAAAAREAQRRGPHTVHYTHTVHLPSAHH